MNDGDVPAGRALLGGVLFFAALGAGLVAVLVTALHAGDLPETIPVHFDLAGRPDGWAERSAFHVWIFPLLALTAGPAIAALGWAMALGRGAGNDRAGGRSRRDAKRLLSDTGLFLAVLGTLIAVMFAAFSIGAIRIALGQAERMHPLGVVLGGLAFLFTIGGGLTLAVRTGRLRKNPDASDARHWRAGSIYVNRDDPAIFVPKRFGMGYTINFGHRGAVLGFTAFLLLILAGPLWLLVSWLAS